VHGAPLARYRQQLATRLARINLRALPWFGATPAAIQLALAESVVLPRLVHIADSARSLGLGDVLADTPRAVIHGEPGAGKTTLLGCLCLAYADEQSDLLSRIEAQRSKRTKPTPTALVPVLLRMVEFSPARESPQELDKFIAATLRDDHDEAISDAVMAAIHAGQGLVCLDGLDEIADDAVRERVVRVIETWASRTSGPCLLTTRFHGSLPLADFTRLAVQAFTTGDMREFMIRRDYARTRDIAVATATADAWMARVWSRPELRSLLRQPLLVELALAAEAAGRRLPTQRVFLYESAIEMLVRAWNKARRPDALKNAGGAAVDAEAVLAALAASALALFEDGALGRSVHRVELRRRMGRGLGGGALGEDLAGAAIEVLVDQAGLLVPDGPDTLTFLHASYGEYLAAKALVRAARHHPERILQRINSAQSREVVCMALGVAHHIEHDPPCASLLFASLLSGDGGGPWQRLSGAAIRVAVEAVLDGHPLEAPGFSRLLARVLGLIERAPLWVNAQALQSLARARPDFAVGTDEARRIIALLGTPALPWEGVEALTRWIARLTPHSPAARACCEQALKRGHGQDRIWAALGLLRAGIVRRDLCRVLDEFLRNYHGDSPRERIIHDELGGPDATDHRQRIAALRELLAPVVPETPHRRIIFADNEALQARIEPAVVLAALGDDSDEVLAILAAGASAQRSSRTSCRSALLWLTHTGDVACPWLAAALLASDDSLRGIAREVLVAVLKRPQQAATATRALFAAIAEAPQLLPNPAAILTRDEPSWTLQWRAPTLLDALHELAGAAPMALLTAHWRALDNTRPRWVRWVMAAVLWRSAIDHADPTLAGPAQCLVEATRDHDLVIAVGSASLLARGWEHLSDAAQHAVIAGWIRGLASNGPRVEGEPVDPVCLSAWQHLRDRVDDGGVRAALRAAMADTEGTPAAVMATLMQDDRLVGLRARALLGEALAGDEPQRAFIAVRGLEKGESIALLEPLHVAQIRLMFAGWLGFWAPRIAATRAMIDAFLSVPAATLERDPVKRDIAARSLLPWLTQHPDARALAFARLSASDTSLRGRAAQLLAACMTTPEQAAAVVTEATDAGPQIMGAASLALYEQCLQSEYDSPLGVAARQGVGRLSSPLLEHHDLGVVRAAVLRLAYVSSYDTPSLPAARARLLGAPDPMWRIEQIEDWLGIRCPARWREASARQQFGCGLADLAAALRACPATADPCLAMRAGLLLIALRMASHASHDASTLVRGVVRRLVLGECAADVARLCELCRGLLNDAATGEQAVPEDEDESFADRDARYALLWSSAARQLDQYLCGRRGYPRVWTWAVLTLVELDDDAAAPALVPLLAGSHSLAWYLVPWLVEHRPRWIPAFEAQIVGHWAPMHWRRLAQQVDALRRAQALSPTLLARLAVHWAERLDEAAQCPAEFSAFIGGPEPPPPDLRATWRGQLEGQDSALQDRAALALAGCGAADDAIVDRLIDAFLSWRLPAAQRAFAALLSPPCAEIFADRRRERARRWQTPEDAAALASLWSDWSEVERDRDVVVPLLQAAARAAERETAVCAALDLWHLDRRAALAALTALIPRSTRAAAWLVIHGEAGLPAEARLWQGLEQIDDPTYEWEPAAVLLQQRAPDDPRLPVALAQLAGSRDNDAAIWLLYGHSRVAAVAATIERLASDPAGHASEWLAAIHRGQRPGRRPTPDISGYWSRIVLDFPTTDPEFALALEDFDQPWFKLRGVTPLAVMAERLSELEPLLTPGMREAMAGLLGGDAPRWTELWQRVHAHESTPQDVDAVREIVELRADDRPGQQLARLWWRHKLAMTTLLDREERARRPWAVAATEAQLLDGILAGGFPDDPSLRRFLAGMGLHDQVVGPTASLQQLRADAVRLLLARGEADVAVQRAAEQSAISTQERLTWETRGVRQGTRPCDARCPGRPLP
jgi:hypothetical protein